MNVGSATPTSLFLLADTFASMLDSGNKIIFNKVDLVAHLHLLI